MLDLINCQPPNYQDFRACAALAVVDNPFFLRSARKEPARPKKSREMTDEIIEFHVETNQSRGDAWAMNSIRKSNTLERSKHSKAGAKQDAKQRRAGAKDAKRRMQTNRSIATMAKEHATRRDRIEFEFEIEKRKESNEFQIERAEPTATEKDPVGIESQRSIEGDVLELTVGRRGGEERNQVQNLGTSDERAKLERARQKKSKRVSKIPRQTRHNPPSKPVKVTNRTKMTNLTESRSIHQPPYHFKIEAAVDQKRTRWRPQEGAKSAGPRVQQNKLTINEEQSKRPRVLDLQGCKRSSDKSNRDERRIKIKSRPNQGQNQAIETYAPKEINLISTTSTWGTKNKEERRPRLTRTPKNAEDKCKNAQQRMLHCKGVLDLVKSLRTVQPTSRQAGKKYFHFQMCLHCFLV